MNCDQALVLIYDLVDDEILPEDKTLLDSHLAICVHCQATLKSIKMAETRYKSELLVSPVTTATEITTQVLQNKNVFSLPAKNPHWSTKRIVYYVGAMAASFAAFIYLTGSLIVANLISKIDFTSAINEMASNKNFQLDISFSQLIESKNNFLATLATMDNTFSQSTVLKDLAVVFFLLSLQFTISYVFAQSKPKQDKKL